ncbi:enolase C-terminal domain-like protein [Brachybacterium sp. AOP29-B2-41]|uniref:enolase C-terminal domain-like protein n=1 Tax=Brachybacterium sp. AOP29-B2-41 TaxID=3457704 RepID=UPI004034EDE9
MNADLWSGTARATDIRVVDVDVSFADVELDPPFVISGRPMTHVTSTKVRLVVETLSGVRATGLGAGMLSVPWAWPQSEIDLSARDDVLRSLVQAFAEQLLDLDLRGDPFTLWRPLEDQLDATLADAADAARIEEIPRLAGLLTLGAVDNALHDAWARAAGCSVYSMYTATHLNQDLAWLSPEFTGIHPGDFLGPARTLIPIQHALGVGDPLTDADVVAGGRSLERWVREQGIRHLKMKLTGNPVADASRISEAYRVMIALVREPTFSLDPNEAYSVGDLGDMLGRLQRLDPAAAGSITYLEQPFPRDHETDAQQMTPLSARVPVLLDEGYSRLQQLLDLRDQGWSGVVIKSAKGQSHAMVTYAAARTLDLSIAIQDLTTVDVALEHSLGLAASLQASWPQVEHNSRQFAPGANAELAARSPALVAVREGHARWTPGKVGLYGG